MNDPAAVHVIDDDDAVRGGLRLLLEAEQYRVEDYASAQDFLANCSTASRGCLISDIRMPGIDGLELQSLLAQRGVELPIIMLTGHADVPAAVRSLKAGALDFLEKPFDPAELLALVHDAFELDAAKHCAREQAQRRDALLGRLTPRELEVVRLVAAGHSNKVVAIDLGISERTVELHRSRGMKKLEVRTVADLVHLLGNSATAADAAGG